MAMIHPKEDEVRTISEAKLNELQSAATHVELPQDPTMADRIDHSYAINMIFGLVRSIAAKPRLRLPPLLARALDARRSV